ncbi:MAG: DUF2079 domain-containing protein [Planctomycetes bacterium]|nr:DUF2079 domain-containing protein [Planctomycetota bacterium]
MLGYNLLSDNPSQSSIYFHYLAPAIPFVFLSAILGAERVQRNWERAFQWLGVAPDLKSQIPDLRPEPGASAKSAGSGQSAVPTPQPPIQNPKSKIQNHAAALYLFIFAALALRLDCPLTKRISFPYHEVYALERRPHEPEFLEAAKLIPPDASLATTMPFAPHLSHRRNLRLIWPVKNWGIPDVDFALLDLSDFRWSQFPTGEGAKRFLLHQVAEAITNRDFGVRYLKNEVVLLQRGLRRTPESDRLWPYLLKEWHGTEAGR